MKALLKSVARKLPETLLRRVAESDRLPLGLRHFVAYRLADNARDSWEERKRVILKNLSKREDCLCPGASAISVDFFDTLFTRTCANPQDLYWYLGFQLAREGVFETPNQFVALRNGSERSVRLSKAGGDVTIAEAYEEMRRIGCWSSDLATTVMTREIALEKATLIPRQSSVDLMAQLRELVPRMVVVSDTYLPSSLLQEIIKESGIQHLFDAIYASCEVDKRKDSGTIWPWLIDREAPTQSNQLVHIGDNYHSDFLMPGKFGICGRKIPSALESAELRGYPTPERQEVETDGWKAGIALGPAIAKIGNDPFFLHTSGRVEPQSPFDFGYAVMGPLMFRFLSWLHEQIGRHGIKRVNFSARDGYFMHKAYESVSRLASELELPPANYLYVSRRSVLPAAMCARFDPNLLLGSTGFTGTIDEFLGARLGIDSTAIPPTTLGKAIFDTRTDASMIATALNANRPAIMRACQDARAALNNYLQSVGFTGGLDEALVDIGYSGTIQRCLQSSLDRPISGFYMLTKPEVECVRTDGGRAQTCFANDPLPGGLKAESVASIALEALLAAPHGQVLGYSLKEGKSTPCYSREPDSRERFLALEESANGMERYCLELVERYGPSVIRMHSSSKKLTEPFMQFVEGQIPAPERLLSALVVENEFSGAGLVKISDRLRKVQRPLPPHANETADVD